MRKTLYSFLAPHLTISPRNSHFDSLNFFYQWFNDLHSYFPLSKSLSWVVASASALPCPTLPCHLTPWKGGGGVAKSIINNDSAERFLRRTDFSGDDKYT